MNFNFWQFDFNVTISDFNNLSCFDPVSWVTENFLDQPFGTSYLTVSEIRHSPLTF